MLPLNWRRHRENCMTQILSECWLYVPAAHSIRPLCIRLPFSPSLPPLCLFCCCYFILADPLGRLLLLPLKQENSVTDYPSEPFKTLTNCMVLPFFAVLAVIYFPPWISKVYIMDVSTRLTFTIGFRPVSNFWLDCWFPSGWCCGCPSGLSERIEQGVAKPQYAVLLRVLQHRNTVQDSHSIYFCFKVKTLEAAAKWLRFALCLSFLFALLAALISCTFTLLLPSQQN